MAAPRIARLHGELESYSVVQLHDIRTCLGFEFKTGNKAALVTATLEFFSALEPEGSAQAWLESLPPYLSRAIEAATFTGFVAAESVEMMTDEPVTIQEKSGYYHRPELNPDLRLGIFDHYARYGSNLLILKPVVRRLLAAVLPVPPHFGVHPCATPGGEGWSTVETLSESMPLLLRSIEQLAASPPTIEKIVRRGLGATEIRELRRKSAFPAFPIGGKTGADPIELIARFVMINPTLIVGSDKRDIRGLIKELLTTFLTKPGSGRIVSYYLGIDSNFEFSALCPHISKGRGPRFDQSFFPVFPPSRTIFAQLITRVAESGEWYDLNAAAESLRMQALPFLPFGYEQGTTELLVKGDELTTPEGLLATSAWQNGFAFDDYLSHTLITGPLLKGYGYLMAALGILEIQEEDPPRALRKGRKLTTVSPFDGLTRVRITPFGAWCLGYSQQQPELRAVHYEAIADRELPLITYRGQSLECKVFLERIGTSIGEDRFRVTEASFIRDCTNPKDIGERIREFRRLIDREPAAHWEELFARIQLRSRLFEGEEACVLIRLPEDQALRHLFLQDKRLSSLVVRAEGGRIVVTQQNYRKLRKALEEYGVLKG